MKRLALVLLALLPPAVSGCAHAPKMEAPTSATIPSDMAFGELPAQNLREGQCALVLWTRKSPPLRFLMALNEPAVARVQLQGTVMELQRVAQSGQPLYGQFPEQHYRGNGLSLGVTFATADAGTLNSGAVVSAIVDYADPQGWTAIIPAVGLIACQT